MSLALEFKYWKIVGLKQIIYLCNWYLTRKLTQYQHANVRNSQIEHVVVGRCTHVFVRHDDETNADVSDDACDVNHGIDDRNEHRLRQTPDSPVPHVSLHVFSLIKSPV